MVSLIASPLEVVAEAAEVVEVVEVDLPFRLSCYLSYYLSCRLVALVVWVALVREFLVVWYRTVSPFGQRSVLTQLRCLGRGVRCLIRQGIRQTV